ncbi:uncharacterized protein LOC118150466 isoform X2 [Callithrix jacchus]
MAPEPGKVRKRSSKRPSVGEICPVHSGVDPQEDQDLSTDCGVRSLRASSLPTRCILAPPPTAPATGQPLPASTRLFILGQLRTGQLSCGAQGLPSRKRIGGLAPRREGWAGNRTLRAAQRSENLWKSDLALGVLSQGHESPGGTENRWHSANTSRRRRMRPSSWDGWPQGGATAQSCTACLASGLPQRRLLSRGPPAVLHCLRIEADTFGPGIRSSSRPSLCSLPLS